MNADTIHYLNIFLGLGAIMLQVFSIIVLFLFFFNKENNKFLNFIKKHFLIIGFLISLFASVFSLIYSEIIGFPPCELCWYQRVFMFPQVFLFGIALLEKFTRNTSQSEVGGNIKIIKYSMSLLSVGFIISLYQNIVYYFGNKASVPCDASGVSCYKQLISEFGGYISIPMLSLTTFVSLIVLLLVAYFYKKDELL
jgi:disulfide bond formation protein DsbB